MPPGRDDARPARDVDAPEDAAGRPVERPHLGGGADDEAVAAEVRRAEIDARDDGAPARGVAEAGAGERGGGRRGAGLDQRGGEGAVGLGRGVDLRVGLATPRGGPRCPRGARAAARRGGGSRPGSDRGGGWRGRGSARRRAPPRGRRRRRGRGRCARRGGRRRPRPPRVRASWPSAETRTPTRTPAASPRAFSGEAALPGVEGAARELDEALGDEDRVALAEVDGAPADLGADASAEEEGVEIGALDRLAGVAGVGERLRASRTRRRRRAARRARARRRPGRAPGRGRRRAGASGRIAAAARRPRRARCGRRIDGAALRAGGAGARPARTRSMALADGRDDVVEGHRAVVDGHHRLGAGAVDAEAGGRAEALDADLPGLVVEADGGLAARARGEVDEGERRGRAGRRRRASRGRAP